MTIKLQLAAVATALLGLTGAASAAPITLTFEGLRDNEAINGFYNGGTGSLGSSGTNHSVQFNSNSLAVIDSDAGGSGNIGNEPTPSTVLFFLTGSAILNYAPGFDTGFSFYYTTVSFAGTVSVYDGLNASGNLLGSINLAALGAGPGDPTGAFSNWAIGSLGFAGTAMSIDFGGTVNQVAYDNVTFGSTNPNGVPEPASMALVGVALAGLCLVRRRRTA